MLPQLSSLLQVELCRLGVIGASNLKTEWKERRKAMEYPQTIWLVYRPAGDGLHLGSAVFTVQPKAENLPAGSVVSQYTLSSVKQTQVAYTFEDLDF